MFVCFGYFASNTGRPYCGSSCSASLNLACDKGVGLQIPSSPSGMMLPRAMGVAVQPTWRATHLEASAPFYLGFWILQNTCGHRILCCRTQAGLLQGFCHVLRQCRVWDLQVSANVLNLPLVMKLCGFPWDQIAQKTIRGPKV